MDIMMIDEPISINLNGIEDVKLLSINIGIIYMPFIPKPFKEQNRLENFMENILILKQ